MRKRNPQVNAVVSPEIMEKLVSRAEAMGATKSQYASLVIQHWVAQGCPAVNEEDLRAREGKDGSHSVPAAAGSR